MSDRLVTQTSFGSVGSSETHGVRSASQGTAEGGQLEIEIGEPWNIGTTWIAASLCLVIVAFGLAGAATSKKMSK